MARPTPCDPERGLSSRTRANSQLSSTYWAVAILGCVTIPWGLSPTEYKLYVHIRGQCVSGPRGFQKVFWILLLIGIALLFLSGCSQSGSSADATGGEARAAGRPQRRRRRCSGHGRGGLPRDVPVEVQVIGNVEAYSTISVRAQVGGQLTKVSFHEGDYVKKNDLLF